MANVSVDFEASNNTVKLVKFHLSIGVRVALSFYVCFLMIVGITANLVFLLVIKQHPRIRRAAASVSLIYITILNLVNCCLLNSFSLAAILNEKTRQSVLYCKLYLVFSSLFMKMFALALIVCAVISNIEVVRWSADKRRIRLGCKLALVISSLFVIADSSPLYNGLEITSDPTCFVVRDDNPLRIVWITETLIVMLLPLIVCIVTLILTVKKIRETKSRVVAHPPKAGSHSAHNVPSRKRNTRGTDSKSLASVGASHSVLAEKQTSPSFLPSSSSSTAMTGGLDAENTSHVDRGPTTAWSKSSIKGNAPDSNPEAKHRLMDLCCCTCRQFIFGEEVRMMLLVFFLCLTLIISWTPSAVMVGGSPSNSPTFLNYILIRVAYLTTIHPSVIPLAFLYTNKHFEGGFVAFFRSLSNRKV